MAKAMLLDGSKNQGRRLEDRKRLDTVVVLAVNNANTMMLYNKRYSIMEVKALVYELWG